MNSAIPAAAQTLAVQFLSGSTVSKPVQRTRPPFIIFSVEKYGELKKANPGVRVADISRMTGQLWRLLPDDQKEVYRARYREEKAAHEERLAKMTELERFQLRDAVQQKRKQRKLRQRRKLNRLLGKPKRGDINPFVLFMKSKTVERGDAPVAQYLKGLAELWKIMPVEDKEEYVKLARVNSAQYRQKLVEWEKKAMAEGHPELVRRQTAKKTGPRVRVGRPKLKPVSKAARPKAKAVAAKRKTRAKDASTQTGAPSAGKTATPKRTASRKKTSAVEE